MLISASIPRAPNSRAPCPNSSTSRRATACASGSCCRRRATPRACRSRTAFRTRRWRSSRPTAIASRGSKSRRGFSASTRSATSARTCWAISVASTRRTSRSSRTTASARTTAAPTTSARPASRRPTSRSCTAPPGSSRSRSMPAAAAFVPSRARRRCRATTSR